LVNYVKQNIGKQTVAFHKSSPELNIADQIEKIADLKEQGILTEEEFKKAKAKILVQTHHSPPDSGTCNHEGQVGKFCTQCGQRVN